MVKLDAQLRPHCADGKVNDKITEIRAELNLVEYDEGTNLTTPK